MLTENRSLNQRSPNVDCAPGVRRAARQSAVAAAFMSERRANLVFCMSGWMFTRIASTSRFAKRRAMPSPTHLGVVAGDLEAVTKALRRQVSVGRKLHIVFVLARHFAGLGWHCEVVAPSSIPRAPGERVKTTGATPSSWPSSLVPATGAHAHDQGTRNIQEADLEGVSACEGQWRRRGVDHETIEKFES